MIIQLINQRTNWFCLLRVESVCDEKKEYESDDNEWLSWIKNRIDENPKLFEKRVVSFGDKTQQCRADLRESLQEFLLNSFVDKKRFVRA